MSISSISSWWALKFNFSFKEGYWEGNKWLTLIRSNQLKWSRVRLGKTHLPHSHVTVGASCDKKLQVRAEAHTLLQRVLRAEVWLHLSNFFHQYLHRGVHRLGSITSTTILGFRPSPPGTSLLPRSCKISIEKCPLRGLLELSKRKNNSRYDVQGPPTDHS